MNAGLSNLAVLKAWLLPSGMVAGTDYNDQILAIGLGVAAQIEEFCNRKFERLVADTFECDANRPHVVLPRYPVEELTTIELRDDLASGWVDQGAIATLVQQLREQSGLVEFSSAGGAAGSLLRFTYTGGYWWNQQEADYDPPETPTEEDPDLSVLPDGATAVPDNLQLAWRLQCELVWKQRDKLGLNIGEKPNEVFMGSLSRVSLLDGVKEMLQPFKRFTLT